MPHANETNTRITAAREAIGSAGGPKRLAARLAASLGVDMDPKRIAQWRYRGIPDEWTTIIEHATGVNRERLNPHLYDVGVAHRVIHKKLTKQKQGKTVA